MSPILSLVNGGSLDTVPITDRGLAYGDGLFETVKVERRRPLLLRRHLDRLACHGARLMLPVPVSLINVIAEEVRQICEQLDEETAVIKITLTRGSGGRGYRPDPGAVPTRIVAAYSAPDYPQHLVEEGVDVRLCNIRLAINPALAGIKHLNRLEQVLARAEWEGEYQEGLLCDMDGRVVEGTMSNLFLVRGDALVTPRLDRAGVAGVMRQLVIDRAVASAVEVLETDLVPDDLRTADGVLLTNSLIGCWPVRRLENLTYAIPDLYSRVCEWIREAEASEC